MTTVEIIKAIRDGKRPVTLHRDDCERLFRFLSDACVSGTQWAAALTRADNRDKEHLAQCLANTLQALPERKEE